MRSPQHRGPFVACVALTVGCGAFLGHALTTTGFVENFREPISMAHQSVADAVRLDPDTSRWNAAAGPAVFRAPESVVVVPATSDLAVSSLVSTTGHRAGNGGRHGASHPGHGHGADHGTSDSHVSAPTGPGSSHGSSVSDGQGAEAGQGGSDARDTVTTPSLPGWSVPTLTNPSGKTPPGQDKGLPTVSAAIGHSQVSVTVDARRVTGTSVSVPTGSAVTSSTGATDPVRPGRHVKAAPGKHSAKLVKHQTRQQLAPKPSVRHEVKHEVKDEAKDAAHHGQHAGRHSQDGAGHQHGHQQAPGKHRAEKPGKHRR